MDPMVQIKLYTFCKILFFCSKFFQKVNNMCVIIIFRNLGVNHVNAYLIYRVSQKK